MKSPVQAAPVRCQGASKTSGAGVRQSGCCVWAGPICVVSSPLCP